MKTKKDRLLNKINKYQKRHMVTYRKHFMFFRRKMTVIYDGEDKLLFYDYYSKDKKYRISKDVLMFTCRDFYDRVDNVLKNCSCTEVCTFDVLHIYSFEAFFKFAKFLMDVEEYYELYYNSDSIVDVKKLDRRKEFSDVYDIIDNIK